MYTYVLCIKNNNYDKINVNKTIDLYNLFDLNDNTQLNRM